MRTESLHIGATKRVIGTFFDFAGAPADPATITLKIKEPDDVVVTKTHPADVTQDSTGVYHFDFATTKPGRHVVRWIGTGAVAAVDEIEFYCLWSGT